MGAWLIWKHRNACVFEGGSPCISRLLHEFRDEYHLWCMASAKSLATLRAGTMGQPS
ncbi:hypothetical protein PR202_ga23105 [Eleusine coracana subsp. coracana]|uniref:Uncharacterized protein n=1 Tax=Eleusine coracana subsp. coracana TaxID=191504 RepID=A0AAV5D4F8_ELECO|nr:hypothetical protein PR202_ga23105 [Eleusine coracana subsp. coracana]